MAWTGLTLPKESINHKIPIKLITENLPPGALPAWNRLSFDAKLPLPAAPKDGLILTYSKLGHSRHHSHCSRDFELSDPMNIDHPKLEYNCLMDPNLKNYFLNSKRFQRLLKNKEITRDGRVLSTLEDYNTHRRYLWTLWGLKVNDLWKKQLHEEKMRCENLLASNVKSVSGKVPTAFMEEVRTWERKLLIMASDTPGTSISKEDKDGQTPKAKESPKRLLQTPHDKRWDKYQRTLKKEFQEDYPAVKEWLDGSTNCYRIVTDKQIKDREAKLLKVEQNFEKLKRSNIQSFAEEQKTRAKEKELQERSRMKRKKDFQKIWDKNGARLATSKKRRQSKIQKEIDKATEIVQKFRAKKEKELELFESKEFELDDTRTKFPLEDTLRSTMKSLKSRHDNSGHGYDSEDEEAKLDFEERQKHLNKVLAEFPVLTDMDSEKTKAIIENIELIDDERPMNSADLDFELKECLKYVQTIIESVLNMSNTTTDLLENQKNIKDMVQEVGCKLEEIGSDELPPVEDIGTRIDVLKNSQMLIKLMIKRIEEDTMGPAISTTKIKEILKKINAEIPVEEKRQEVKEREQKRLREEEEERKRHEEEKRLRKENEERRKAREDEMKRKLKEDRERKKAEREEKQKAEDEIRKQKAEEKKRKQKAEEEKRKQAAEKEKLKQTAEEEQRKQTAEEEEQRLKVEGEESKLLDEQKQVDDEQKGKDEEGREKRKSEEDSEKRMSEEGREKRMNEEGREKRKSEDDNKRKVEDERKYEDKRKDEDEDKRKDEDENKRKDEDENKRKDEEDGNKRKDEEEGNKVQDNREKEDKNFEEETGFEQEDKKKMVEDLRNIEEKEEQKLEKESEIKTKVGVDRNEIETKEDNIKSSEEKAKDEADKTKANAEVLQSSEKEDKNEDKSYTTNYCKCIYFTPGNIHSMVFFRRKQKYYEKSILTTKEKNENINNKKKITDYNNYFHSTITDTPKLITITKKFTQNRKGKISSSLEYTRKEKECISKEDNKCVTNPEIPATMDYYKKNQSSDNLANNEGQKEFQQSSALPVNNDCRLLLLIDEMKNFRSFPTSIDSSQTPIVSKNDIPKNNERISKTYELHKLFESYYDEMKKKISSKLEGNMINIYKDEISTVDHIESFREYVPTIITTEMKSEIRKNLTNSWFYKLYPEFFKTNNLTDQSEISMPRLSNIEQFQNPNDGIGFKCHQLQVENLNDIRKILLADKTLTLEDRCLALSVAKLKKDICKEVPDLSNEADFQDETLQNFNVHQEIKLPARPMSPVRKQTTFTKTMKGNGIRIQCTGVITVTSTPTNSPKMFQKNDIYNLSPKKLDVTFGNPMTVAENHGLRISSGISGSKSTVDEKLKDNFKHVKAHSSKQETNVESNDSTLNKNIKETTLENNRYFSHSKESPSFPMISNEDVKITEDAITALDANDILTEFYSEVFEGKRYISKSLTTTKDCDEVTVIEADSVDTEHEEKILEKSNRSNEYNPNQYQEHRLSQGTSRFLTDESFGAAKKSHVQKDALPNRSWQEKTPEVEPRKGSRFAYEEKNRTLLSDVEEPEINFVEDMPKFSTTAGNDEDI